MEEHLSVQLFNNGRCDLDFISSAAALPTSKSIETRAASPNLNMAKSKNNVCFQEHLNALLADITVIDLCQPLQLEPTESVVDAQISEERRPVIQRKDEHGDQARRDHHNVHTRKCRARLKFKMQSLLAALPPPPDSREVKHQAQVLDYAIDTFQTLDDELVELEWQLALSSHAHLLRWVSARVRDVHYLADALQPFEKLFCARMGFVCAECWRQGSGITKWFVERTHIQRQKWCSQADLIRLGIAGEDVTNAQHLFDASVPPLRSVLQSMQPVSCNALDIRLGNTIPTALLVPVLVAGEVRRVIAFFDVRTRPIEPDIERLAIVVASTVGNVFCASEHERDNKKKT